MDAVTRPSAAEPVAEAPIAALPDEAPLAMPVQDLGRAERAPRPATAPPAIEVRRLVVFGGAALLGGLAAYEMYRVLDVGGLTALEAVVLVLFVVLSCWIAFAFVSALCGLPGLLLRRNRLGIDPAAPLPPVEGRTALLLPTYNEDPARVFAGLAATLGSLAATGQGGRFDAFVLSDTTDADVWIAEEAAYLALAVRLASEGGVAVYYRHRAANTDRKAGNIAEWVRRFGGGYRAMLVLDADSLMSGDTIVRLAAAIDRNPGVGLIQTLPVLVGGRTLFARCQQFAGRLYGPLLAHGLTTWQGSEGNYWGHNAIIRTAAFAAAAGLPRLPGKAPFGGTILSHDFVEAALIRRAGWAVHMVPALGGSYEEGPPTLTDLAVRDRRWCQGNLQHALVLPARGLAFASRLHMLIGIGSYVAAPLWLAMLGAGLLIALQARFVPPDYFPTGFSLFPRWPAQDPVRAAWVFAATIAALLAPKLAAFLAMLCDGRQRRAFGGLAALPGLLVETVFSALAAPVMMVVQSTGIFAVLRGRDSGWRTQRRDDGSIPVRETARMYAGATLIGAALAGAAYAIAPTLFLWMSPVILGLALAVPIAAVSGRRGAGDALARLGILATPEDRDPPEVIRRMRRHLEEGAPVVTEAVARLAADPALTAAHRAMLPNGGRRAPGEVAPARLVGRAKVEDAETLAGALAALSPAEKTAALGDAAALDRLLQLAAARTART